MFPNLLSWHKRHRSPFKLGELWVVDLKAPSQSVSFTCPLPALYSTSATSNRFCCCAVRSLLSLLLAVQLAVGSQSSPHNSRAPSRWPHSNPLSVLFQNPPLTTSFMNAYSRCCLLGISVLLGLSGFFGISVLHLREQFSSVVLKMVSLDHKASPQQMTSIELNYSI